MAYLCFCKFWINIQKDSQQPTILKHFLPKTKWRFLLFNKSAITFLILFNVFILDKKKKKKHMKNQIYKTKSNPSEAKECDHV